VRLIKEGDKVELVYLDSGNHLMCDAVEITHTPAGEGDLWEVKSLLNGQVHLINPYARCFVRMSRDLKKSEDA